MDGERFDSLARTIGQRLTRRAALRWTGSAGVAAALTALKLRFAAASVKEPKGPDQAFAEFQKIAQQMLANPKLQHVLDSLEDPVVAARAQGNPTRFLADAGFKLSRGTRVMIAEACPAEEVGATRAMRALKVKHLVVTICFASWCVTIEKKPPAEK